MMHMLTEYAMAMVAFYRASQDSGFWMLDREFMRDYLESFLISKGKM